MILFAILPTIAPQSPMLTARVPELSARALDFLLQAYAFRAFVNPRTGIPVDGSPPANLTGVKISALRLRSGSLGTRGFGRYKEFFIPTGVAEQPYAARIVLVYHNLGNWSSLYYPLPGYTYLAPIVGLLAYDASDLSAENLPELDLRASESPITIEFRGLKSAPGDGSSPSPKCVRFDLHGSVEFDNVVDGNVCSVSGQGHFSIVVEFTDTSPTPGVEIPPASSNGGGSGYKKQNYDGVWSIAAAAACGSILMVVLGLLVVFVKKYRRRKGIGRSEKTAEGSHPLQTRSLGGSKVPMATETRTRPVLENEYDVP
ncbi:hypothetical protein U1Q18_020639 [Sarracenia purpurea var. burkii]